MSLIRLDDVGLEFSGTFLFKNISCTVEHNSRIGLIGANGCGKSTLLKLMLRELQPSLGTVSRAKQQKIAYLSQNPEYLQDMTLEQYIHSTRPDILAAWQEMQELAEALQSDDVAVAPEIASSPLPPPPSADEFLNRLHKAEERFNNLGGYEFDTRMKLTLTALKFPLETWKRHLDSFSGGERTRLTLAHFLLSEYDLLLLDEPTNHLDIAMTQWLEQFLINQSRPYLIISHDRTFLDKTVSSIYSMEMGSLSITKGNFNSWYEARQIRLLEQERAWKKQQKWLKDQEDFIARNMAGQKTKQAQGRLKILNRTELIDKPQAESKINLAIRNADRSGNDVCRIENMAFGIGDKLLAQEVNLYCGYKDRICLLGQNGSGKTTLIKLLLGELEPLQGRVKMGASLNIGYYDQYQNELDESATVFDTIKELVPMATDGYILGWLARFGFREDDVKKVVSVLSGGEKSRLYLSVLIHAKPNLLILDEPTNHLDIMMMDALLEALKDYEGTIIFVSHDRYFIKELADKYWILQKVLEDGRKFPSIREIDKPFAELLEIAYNEPEIEKPKTEQVRNRVKKVNPWVLEQIHKDIAGKHAEIAAYQAQLDDIHNRLAASETYSKTELVYDLQKTMKELEDSIATAHLEADDLETKYLEMSYDPPN